MVMTLSCVKLPLMMALPSVMAVFTLAVLTFCSSIQMLMYPLLAASSVVASAKACLPLPLNSKER